MLSLLQGNEQTTNEELRLSDNLERPIRILGLHIKKAV